VEAASSPLRRIQPAAIGSRASRLRASHSYGVVLALIVVSFFFASLAPDDAWTVSVLLLGYAAILAVALWTSGLTGVDFRWRAALVALAALVAVVHLIVGGSSLYGIVAILTGVLIAAAILVVALGVADQRGVNAQSVQGAVCVYLLFGLLFVFVYGAVAALGHSPFFLDGTDGDRGLRVYFSFVTLATLGYGDFTPGTDFGRSLAITEAILGQLYLVTVVALLVSRIGLRQQTRQEDLSGAPPEDDAPAGAAGG
jgi:ion channel